MYIDGDAISLNDAFRATWIYKGFKIQILKLRYFDRIFKFFNTSLKQQFLK